MNRQATAAIIDELGGDFILDTVEIDGIQDDEVLVRIQACGVCHTDLKVQERIPLPAVLGHEGAGVIEEVGRKVGNFGRGDRVILSYPSCGRCKPCDSSQPFRCERISALKFGACRLDGTQPISWRGKPLSSAFFQQSSFATRAVAHQATLVKVDTDKPPELLAALPCGVQTGAGAIMNTFDVHPGEPIIIIGAGAVGISAILAAVFVGADPIIAVDVFDSRLELALELGASHTINAREGDVPLRVREISRIGTQYALETSASVDGLIDAAGCLGQGGTLGVVSPPETTDVFPFNAREFFQRVAKLECIVQGSSIPREFIPKLIQLNEQGHFPYEKLVRTYDFSEINKAVDDAKSGTAVKPVLIMPQS